jgi:hypothetical protein
MMANEFTPLVIVTDHMNDRELHVDVVHREDGSRGYRLQVFDLSLIGSDGDQFDGYIGEVETPPCGWVYH